jgi:hypothetical protein
MCATCCYIVIAMHWVMWLWTLWHYVAAASLHKPQRRANSVWGGWLMVLSALLPLLVRFLLLIAQLSQMTFGAHFQAHQ